jgi:periplasmic nitrate reductase NapD
MREVHISSLVVHSRPERASAIAGVLAGMEGTELHAQSGGKLVITLETETEAEVVERLTAIQLLEGVLAATLVFHHFEPSTEEG